MTPEAAGTLWGCVVIVAASVAVWLAMMGVRRGRQ